MEGRQCGANETYGTNVSGKSACNYPFLVRGAVFKASDVGLSNLCVELGHRPNTSNRQTELETAENTIICCT